MDPNSAQTDQQDVTRLLHDIFATTDDEPTYEQLEEQMILAADRLLSDAESRVQFPQLWHYLERDPVAMDEYRLLMELAQAEAADELVRSVVLPPLPVVQSAQRSAAQVGAELLAQGRAWLQDALGRLYVPLHYDQTFAAAPAWATRTTEVGSLLFQKSFGGDGELAEWEITISAAVEDQHYCRLDISLYNLHDPNRALDGIPLTLMLDIALATAETDANGVASIHHVQQDELDNLLLRIDLDR